MLRDEFNKFINTHTSVPPLPSLPLPSFQDGGAHARAGKLIYGTYVGLTRWSALQIRTRPLFEVYMAKLVVRLPTRKRKNTCYDAIGQNTLTTPGSSMVNTNIESRVGRPSLCYALINHSKIFERKKGHGEPSRPLRFDLP